MDWPVEQHRFAAFTAFGSVDSACHVDAIPRVAKLTAQRRFCGF
jgi:hypothetical protein